MRPHKWQPTRLRRPWDSPGKNTGVGCHFLLQCMKVKSESEVAQLCPTLCDPMDCSPPGSSVPEILQARVWSGLPLPSLTFTWWRFKVMKNRDTTDKNYWNSSIRKSISNFLKQYRKYWSHIYKSKDVVSLSCLKQFFLHLLSSMCMVIS